MTTTNPTARSERNKKLIFIATAGVLAAIASILRYIETPLPLLPAFLKIDFSNIPALIGGFALGPWAAAAVLFIKNVLYLPATMTGGIGEIADFVVSLTLVLPAAIVYRRSHKRSAAIWGMAIGTALMTLVGGPLMNWFVLLPLYTKLMPIEQILAMAQVANPSITTREAYIFYAVIPFNLFKSVAICVITYLLYKPLSPILHKYK